MLRRLVLRVLNVLSPDTKPTHVPNGTLPEGAEAWYEWEGMFAKHKIYVVHGQWDEYDFVSLPMGSYGHYCVCGSDVWWLTREGNEYQRVLAGEWDRLEKVDPVQLAGFILTFLPRVGMRDSNTWGHEVVRDTEALLGMGWVPGEKGERRGSRFIKKELARVLPVMGKTEVWREEGSVVIRAVTLYGWMHEAAELGVETITISRDGGVKLGKRQVLSKKIQDQHPAIVY